MRRVTRRHARPRGRRAGLLLSLLCLALAGCSSYVSDSQRVRSLVATAHYDEALARVGKLGRGSRLLAYYESGLILQDQGRWAASDSVFDLAERALDDLYTHSITRDLSAYLLSDQVMEYRGDAFETAFLHYYRIINFLERGDPEGAAVQARRLAHQLQLWRDADKAFAGEGFFAYVAGLVFREAGVRDDADVAFRNALAAYQTHGAAAGGGVPGDLLCDLAENAAALGDAALAAEYRAQGDCPPLRRNAGRVVLLLESGYVPHKDAAEIVVPIFADDVRDDDIDAVHLGRTLAGRYRYGYDRDVKVDYLLRVSLPQLAVTPPGPTRARVVAVAAAAGRSGTTSLGAITADPALDVAVLAQAAFAEHEPEVLLRAIARGVTKYLATRRAKKEGKGAGFAANLLGVLTENADTRCWSLLPRTVVLAQSELDPGDYRFVIDLLDGAGTAAATLESPIVEVHPGRTTFLRYRVY